ncbi:hypothetical protein TCON_0216 [Astathelohania contejeani]|uniref:Uncharacterized protein n=1 Tax=Astathelohania contejeani TaxID=164912 RepID=A0ABQ7I291_9MICR|nr:hypothetical protein TCON_0216 [Thelohania contejeani]
MNIYRSFLICLFQLSEITCVATNENNDQLILKNDEAKEVLKLFVYEWELRDEKDQRINEKINISNLKNNLLGELNNLENESHIIILIPKKSVDKHMDLICFSSVEIIRQADDNEDIHIHKGCNIYHVGCLDKNIKYICSIPYKEDGLKNYCVNVNLKILKNKKKFKKAVADEFKKFIKQESIDFNEEIGKIYADQLSTLDHERKFGSLDLSYTDRKSNKNVPLPASQDLNIVVNNDLCQSIINSTWDRINEEFENILHRKLDVSESFIDLTRIICDSGIEFNLSSQILHNSDEVNLFDYFKDNITITYKNDKKKELDPAASNILKRHLKIPEIISNIKKLVSSYYKKFIIPRSIIQDNFSDMSFTATPMSAHERINLEPYEDINYDDSTEEASYTTSSSTGVSKYGNTHKKSKNKEKKSGFWYNYKLYIYIGSGIVIISCLWIISYMLLLNKYF